VSVIAATRPATGAQSATGTGHGAGSASGLYRYIAFGASPRASIALHRSARICALFDGRDYVTPADVKAAAVPVLRHRIVMSYEADADGLDADAVIGRILSLVPVP
jgi:MoxR-like ATPase